MPLVEPCETDALKAWNKTKLWEKFLKKHPIDTLDNSTYCRKVISENCSRFYMVKRLAGTNAILLDSLNFAIHGETLDAAPQAMRYAPANRCNGHLSALFFLVHFESLTVDEFKSHLRSYWIYQPTMSTDDLSKVRDFVKKKLQRSIKKLIALNHANGASQEEATTCLLKTAKAIAPPILPTLWQSRSPLPSKQLKSVTWHPSCKTYDGPTPKEKTEVRSGRHPGQM